MRKLLGIRTAIVARNSDAERITPQAQIVACFEVDCDIFAKRCIAARID